MFCGFINNGRSPCDEIFRKSPVMNTPAFSGISRNEDNIARNEVFGNFLQELFVAFDFPSGIFV